MKRAIAAVLIAAAALALPAASRAAFPGSNGKLLYTTSAGLFTINPDGTGPQFVAAGSFGSWSADGERMAFVAAGAEGPGVYVANADGGQMRLLVAGTTVSWPVFTPDGLTVVYQRGPVCAVDECSPSSLRAVGVDGTGDRVLAPYGEGSLVAPEVSPDGTRLAFWKRFDIVSSAGDDSGLYVMSLDGSGRVRLVEVATYPSWSPDASTLAYGQGIQFDGATGRFFQLGLATVGANGTGRAALGTLPGNHPAWSPDGTLIAFASATELCGSLFVCASDLYVMSADGTNPVNITNHSTRTPIFSLDWQPLVNRAPGCADVSAHPSSLWPPNKHLRTVTLVGVTDADGDDVTLRVTGVTHDEGGPPDWQAGASEDQVRLRAARDPKGDGRVYEIAFEATDEHGATCAGEATVTVPRHKKPPLRTGSPPTVHGHMP